MLATSISCHSIKEGQLQRTFKLLQLYLISDEDKSIREMQQKSIPHRIVFPCCSVQRHGYSHSAFYGPVIRFFSLFKSQFVLCYKYNNSHPIAFGKQAYSISIYQNTNMTSIKMLYLAFQNSLLIDLLLLKIKGMQGKRGRGVWLSM